MKLRKIDCKICGEEVFSPNPDENNRKVCAECLPALRDKEKRTYGWFVYHFLKIKKENGKFIIPSEEYTDDKYGLQSIFIDRILNEVSLRFYFGRSFVHRPDLKIPFSIAKNNREWILEMVRGANKVGYTRDGRQNIVERTFEKLNK